MNKPVHRTGQLVKPRPLRSISCTATLSGTADRDDATVATETGRSDHVIQPRSPDPRSELETVKRHVTLLTASMEIQPLHLPALNDLCRLLYTHGKALDDLSSDTVSSAIARLKHAAEHLDHATLPKGLQGEITELVELRHRGWLRAVSPPSLGEFIERYAEQQTRTSATGAPRDAHTSSISDSDSLSTTSESDRNNMNGAVDDSSSELVVEHIDIRATKIGKVFTSDGSRVKLIEEITGTKVELSPTLPESGASLRQIRISGTTASSVQKARVLVDRISKAANSIHIKLILDKARQGEIITPTSAARRILTNSSPPANQQKPTKTWATSQTQTDEASDDGYDGMKMVVTAKNGTVVLTCADPIMLQEACDVLQLHFNKPMWGSLSHIGEGDTNKRPIYRSQSRDTFIRVSAVRKSHPVEQRYSRDELIAVADSPLCHVEPDWPDLPDDVLFNICSPPNKTFYSDIMKADLSEAFWTRQMDDMYAQQTGHRPMPHVSGGPRVSKGGGFGIPSNFRRKYKSEGSEFAGDRSSVNSISLGTKSAGTKSVDNGHAARTRDRHVSCDNNARFNPSGMFQDAPDTSDTSLEYSSSLSQSHDDDDTSARTNEKPSEGSDQLGEPDDGVFEQMRRKDQSSKWNSVAGENIKEQPNAGSVKEGRDEDTKINFTAGSREDGILGPATVNMLKINVYDSLSQCPNNSIMPQNESHGMTGVSSAYITDWNNSSSIVKMVPPNEVSPLVTDEPT